MRESVFHQAVHASALARRITGVDIPFDGWREETTGRLIAAVPGGNRRLAYSVMNGKPLLRLDSWTICCRRKWERAYLSAPWPGDEAHSLGCPLQS